MLKVKYVLLVFSAILLTSCGEESLQKYLVKKQDDPKFLKVDLSPTMLEGKDNNLSEESREALQSIKKVNIVAYPIKDNNLEEFNAQKNEIESILKQERFQELTRIKNPNWNLQVSYTGDESKIDEVIVYGIDNSRGFVIFRLLGNDLKPEQVSSIIQAISEENLDLSGITGLNEIFNSN